MTDSRVPKLSSLFLVLFLSVLLVQSVWSEQVETDPNYIFLPVMLNPEILLKNGGFESGGDYWNQYSSNGWWLIIHRDNLPINPNNGNWATWLGGDDDESSVIWQEVTIPTANPTLVYWMWIASSDYCGYDVGGVTLDIDNVVDAYWLCDDNNTGGWIKRTINLSAYAGDTVDLEFSAFTDSYLISNLYIDDVSLGLSQLDLSEGVSNKPETSSKGLVGKVESRINANRIGGSLSLDTQSQLLESLQESAEHSDTSRQ